MYRIDKVEFWLSIFSAFTLGAIMMFNIYNSGALDNKDTWTDSDIQSVIESREQKKLDKIKKLKQELEELTQ